MQSPVTLLQASANGSGPVIDAGQMVDEAFFTVDADAGVTAFSVSVQSSMDQVDWATIHAAETATTSGVEATASFLGRYFRATLSGYTGTGNVTVKLAFAKN